MLGAVVAATTTGVFLAPLDARAQEAATVAEVKWWSQNPAAAPPEGGFQVAQSPGGDLTVTALRIRVASPSLSAARLILQESQTVGTPTLQLCRITAPWSSTDGDAPEADCSAPVALQRNEPTREWAADVLSLLAGGGDVSVLVVPAPDPANPTPVKAPFQADFTGATIIATGPDPGTDDASAGGGGDLASGDLGTFASDSGLAVAPSATSPDFSLSPVAVPPDLNPAAAPAAAAPPQVPGRFPVRSVAAGGDGSDTPWGRLPLVLVVSAAVGALAAVARQRLQAMGWLPSG